MKHAFVCIHSGYCFYKPASRKLKIDPNIHSYKIGMTGSKGAVITKGLGRREGGWFPQGRALQPSEHYFWIELTGIYYYDGFFFFNANLIKCLAGGVYLPKIEFFGPTPFCKKLYFFPQVQWKFPITFLDKSSYIFTSQPILQNEKYTPWCLVRLFFYMRRAVLLLSDGFYIFTSDEHVQCALPQHLSKLCFCKSWL